MTDVTAGFASREAEFPIAFVGTYPPRRCGIATFTRDLAQATAAASERVLPMILAMTDAGGQYEYPAEVKYEIRQGSNSDYARAAEFVNFSETQLVSIQHEYGIFGGDDGSSILDFLSALRVPSIATLHTVLEGPSDMQKAIVREMARQSASLVVMSRVASDLLRSSYGVTTDKIQIIPHGIPVMEPRDQKRMKAKFSVTGRRMLLTFGLLSANKGIETVIRALPEVVSEFPEVVYFVVGATHPVVRRRDGEAYRTMLEREAERLGVREHLVFRDQFVTNAELFSYLQAADIFVSPYLNEAQVTSGALSYAMGAGTAVVSTPYWHARELLGEGRGCLFPFRDSEALSQSLLGLLRDGAELERLRSAAFDYTRSMLWPHVGKAYVELGRRVASLAPTTSGHPKPVRAGSLPEPRLDHLLRLTDDTGIIQHATFSVPARISGYCVDDNARALIVALHADRSHSSAETRRLVTTYLSYLHHSQTENGGFRNFMLYDRSFEPGPTSDDCIGRAIWALGVTLQLVSEEGSRLLARDMLERALPRSEELGVRGQALVVLGLTSALLADPSSTALRASLDVLVESLLRRYADEASDDWHWFEPVLTYDNALLPLALFKAYRVTGERAGLRIAREALEFLEGKCFSRGQLTLVGNDGWHSRGGSKAQADEQAIDAAAFVLAFRGAYLATGDHHYLGRMRETFAWFLGVNRLGVPLYDFATAGCCDGLGATEANQNQGAESTISFLLALYGMLNLADQGLGGNGTPRSANGERRL